MHAADFAGTTAVVLEHVRPYQLAELIVRARGLSATPSPYGWFLGR